MASLLFSGVVKVPVYRQPFNPIGIAVDKSGNIYVIDEDNFRIQKFTDTGVFITKWGNQGSGDGQFSYPMGIAIDNSGNIYVIDFDARVQKFTSAASLLSNGVVKVPAMTNSLTHQI